MSTPLRLICAAISSADQGMCPAGRRRSARDLSRSACGCRASESAGWVVEFDADHRLLPGNRCARDRSTEPHALSLRDPREPVTCQAICKCYRRIDHRAVSDVREREGRQPRRAHRLPRIGRPVTARHSARATSCLDARLRPSFIRRRRAPWPASAGTSGTSRGAGAGPRASGPGRPGRSSLVGRTSRRESRVASCQEVATCTMMAAAMRSTAQPPA